MNWKKKIDSVEELAYFWRTIGKEETWRFTSLILWYNYITIYRDVIFLREF